MLARRRLTRQRDGDHPNASDELIDWLDLRDVILMSD
jgi:hypothetical protein